MKNKLTTGCGDWHLGWGYGGYNKLGRLTLNPIDNTFTWKGYSQGRHGGTWNKGAFIIFTVSEGKINRIDAKGGYPVASELLNGVNQILRQQKNN